MAWTELHGNLPAHPKLAELADSLGIERWQAVGVLTSLWCFAVDFCEDGMISRWPRFAAYAGIEPSESERFKDALLKTEWMHGEHGKFSIHDWHHYAGRLEEVRRKDRERKQNSRSRPEDVRRTGHGQKRNSEVSAQPTNQPTNQQGGGEQTSKNPPPPFSERVEQELQAFKSALPAGVWQTLAKHEAEYALLIQGWADEGRSSKIGRIGEKMARAAIEGGKTATGKNARYASQRAHEAIQGLAFDKAGKAAV